MIKKSELGKLKMPGMKKKEMEPELEVSVFDMEDDEEPKAKSLKGYDAEEEADSEMMEEADEPEELKEETAAKDEFSDMSDEELEAELARRKKNKAL
jgi:hypothetical protein